MTSIQNNLKRNWYLDETKPKSEFKAQENPSRQGYETYFPFVQSSRRRNGKNIKLIEAFFPCYLFISIDKEADNWEPITSTIGVAVMVSFGHMLVVVSENMITSLKNNENAFYWHIPLI